VTSAALSTRPKNPFGDWIAAKQPMISTLAVAADQVTVLAAGLPRFVTTVQRVSPDPTAKFGSPQGQGTPLVPDASGNAWVVTEIAAPLAASNFWRMLLEPKTQGH
jgi:hypothetical protein